MALIRIKTHHLKKGMLIKSDVYNRSGVILVPAATNTAPVMDISSRSRRLDPQKMKEFTKTYHIAEDTLSQNLKDIVLKDKEVDIPSLPTLTR